MSEDAEHAGHLDRFYAFVADRPCDEAPADAPSCPHCGGCDLVFFMKNTYITALVEHDVTVASYLCKGCRRYFLRQSFRGNVYYTTAESRLLRGVCGDIDVELFCDFNCAACGGRVVKCWLTQDGAETSYRQDGQRITFVCRDCGRSLDTPLESPLDPPRAREEVLDEKVLDPDDDVHQIIHGLD